MREKNKNHLFLAGHNKINIFRVLEKIKENDEIEVTINNLKQNYIVSKIIIVNDTEVNYMNDTEETLLSLMTCVKEKSKRLIVQAKKRL